MRRRHEDLREPTSCKEIWHYSALGTYIIRKTMYGKIAVVFCNLKSKWQVMWFYASYIMYARGREEEGEKQRRTEHVRC